MSRLALFICISRSIFWNFKKLCRNVNIGYAVILPFGDFDLRGQTNVAWHMYKYVLKHPLRQDIFKQTYRNVVFPNLSGSNFIPGHRYSVCRGNRLNALWIINFDCNTLFMYVNQPFQMNNRVLRITWLGVEYSCRSSN